MINRLSQPTYREQKFDSSGVNLHTRATGTSREVIVFVHGLGGGGYATWQEMPQMMFEGIHGSPVDVAIFDYRSGLRSWKRGGANLSAPISRLKSALQDLSDEYKYESIYIAAHSLGGIIAESAIQKLFHGLNKSPVTSLAAVILFASPRAGSGWADFRAFRETRWLKRFSDHVTDAEEHFSSHIEGRASPAADLSRFFLPHYACVASDDLFVSRFSAEVGIPSSQCLPLEGSHTSVVKPNREDYPQVRWLHRIIKDVTTLRAYARTRLAQAGRSSSTVIVSELRAGVHGTDWEEIYNEVRKELSTDSISVEDKQSHPDGPVDILITVRPAEVVFQENSPAQAPILRVYAEYIGRKGGLFVGICTVGESWKSASDLITQWLPGDLERGFYVTGATNDAGVYTVITKWIRAAIQRNSLMQSGSRIDRVLDLAPDPYEIPERKLL